MKSEMNDANVVENRGATAADLVALASEKSPETRLELLRRVTDAYLEEPTGKSPAEQYLIQEIVTKLLGKLGDRHRAEVARTLAKLPKLPENIARGYALDGNIAVAGPFIRDHSGLSEGILIEVAEQGSQDHLHAVAVRPFVTRPVTDVVVARGDRRVIHALAANSGAKFSPAGMGTLAGKATADVDLQAIIVERADLTTAAIALLLPVISEELAARLCSQNVECDETVVRDYLAEWIVERNASMAKVDTYAEGIRNGDLGVNDVITELVQAKRLLDAAHVLAGIIDIDRSFSFNLLTRGKTSFVVVLLRSAEVSWSGADGFLRLRRSKLRLTEDDGRVERSDYEAVDAATAQRVLRFLKVRRMAMNLFAEPRRAG